MKTEMSKTPNPKNECSECGKAIFNEGGKCVTCLVADTKEEETKVWITIPTKPENPNKKKINIKKRKINAENKEENLKIKSTINTNMMKKHKLYYTEKVNVNRAKKIISMNDEDIIKQIYDENEVNQDGKKYTPKEKETYIKNVKDYCKLAILNNGIIHQKYKYSKSLSEQKQGRIYVNKFGIQSLQKKLRGYLSGEYYNDIDMINCFPVLLSWFVTKYYPDVNIINLKKYVAKRDKLLKKYKVGKMDILSWIHRDFPYTGDNTLLLALDDDIKRIQDTLWNDTENEIVNLVDRTTITSTNKRGSLINRVLGIIENNILQGVITDLKNKVSVPYYDGAFVDNSINTTELINKLNDTTSEYGIKWSHKEHSTLNISDEIELEEEEKQSVVLEEKLYGYEFITYKDLKRKFEKNHAIVTAPFEADVTVILSPATR